MEDMVDRLFELIVTPDDKSGEPKTMQLGIRLRLAGQETTFPVCRPCRTYEEVKEEVRILRDALDKIMEEAKGRRAAAKTGDCAGISADMDPAQVWDVLSGLGDEPLMACFNELEGKQRREVADYVLSHRNIFSGKGALFSERFDNETALMNPT
jgi:hypothetical protein